MQNSDVNRVLAYYTVMWCAIADWRWRGVDAVADAETGIPTRVSWHRHASLTSNTSSVTGAPTPKTVTAPLVNFTATVRSARIWVAWIDDRSRDTRSDFFGVPPWVSHQGGW